MSQSAAHRQPQSEQKALYKKATVKARNPAGPKQDKPAKSTKNERLDTRVTSEQKALLQRAAALEGCSMTDFVSRAIQDASMRTIERHQTLKLGLEDSVRVVEALLNPPEPNENLEEAFRRYHAKGVSRK